MRYGTRFSKRTNIFLMGFMALFVLSACNEDEVFQDSRLTSTLGPTATATASTDSSNASAPGSTATSTPDPAVSVATVPPGSTATPPGSLSSVVPPPPQDLTPTATPPPPTASFEADLMFGAAPFDVTFTASVEGVIDSYEWEFGDGTTSNEAAPVHEYTLAGVFTVRLTVTGPTGSSTDFRNGFISVDPGPAVELSIEPQNPVIAAQETINFSADVVDLFGNEVDSHVTWSVDEAAGTITSTGMFTASTVAGDYAKAISVSLSGGSRLMKTIDVSVIPGAIHTISLTPGEITVAVNSFEKFEIQPSDEFGNDIVEFTAMWRTDPIVGSIDDVGGFVSGTRSGEFPGGITVEVDYGATRKTATADIIIEAGPVARVSLKPETIYVPRSGTGRFMAKATDVFGNEVPAVEFTWTTTGGRIGGDGEFIANSDSGTHEVRATVLGESGISGSATAEVMPSSTFVVGTELDSTDISPGDGSCADNDGRCSLRAAVMESNARAGADYIWVPTGTYILTRTGYGEDNSVRGDLDIRGDLFIFGQGPEFSIIDGAASDRVLDVFRGMIVEVIGVTIRNGANFGDESGGRGGGILNQGMLTLTNAAVTNNSVENRGGGIWNQKTLAIIDSEISGNIAGDIGSVVFNVAGATVRIIRTTVSGNRSPHSSIYSEGTFFIDDSTISGNSSGGGLWNLGTMRVTNSTLSGNNPGGGLNQIWNGGDLRIANSTIYSDSTANSVIYGHEPIEFLNAIIVSNSSSACDSKGWYISLGHNIATDLSCSMFRDSDQPGTDALVGPLQDNGGSTETHALLPGSPAIDAGEDAAAPLTDQRGVVRPVGSASDIGAYELQ